MLAAPRSFMIPEAPTPTLRPGAPTPTLPAATPTASSSGSGGVESGPVPRVDRSAATIRPPRPSHARTIWVGTSRTGAEFVVVEADGKVTDVWADEGMHRLLRIEEAVAGSAEVVQRVVIDATTGPGGMLAIAVRDRVAAVHVVEALPDRPIFDELRGFIDQGMAVYHLVQLAELARVSLPQSRRVVAALAPSFEVLERPAERFASIPQTPPPPRPRWLIPAVVLAALLVASLCILLGIYIGER